MKLVPDELKSHAQWLNWKVVSRSGKATKMPIQPNGTPASSTNPETWNEFADLNSNFYAGFVFTQDDPYIGIDLDGCRDPNTGLLDDWAKEIVLKFNTYAEVSPSKTGVKMFAVADSAWQHQNKTELDGEGYGGKKPGIEVYDCGRFFAVTGNRLQGMRDLKQADDELEWLADKFGMKRQAFTPDGSDVPNDTPVLARASAYLAKMEPAISGSRGHDVCFKAACALVLGFDLTTEEAFSLLANEYNARCEPPWSERELRHKVDSAAKQPGQRGYLRDANTKDWNRIFVRSGPSPEPIEDEQPELRQTTLEDAAKLYLKKLKDEGEHLIETGVPELDDAIGGGLAEGEMVIIAGRPSHGKTAVALQMVHHMTRNELPAVIVSEEMSSLAIGKRAVQFVSETDSNEWRTQDARVLSELDQHFAGRANAYIVESCGTAQRVVEEVERYVYDHGVRVVVVDYIQLLASPGKGRAEQVAATSILLRQMASRLGVLLIVLAQLNREIESRKSFVPQVSDLKETGQLEQDADVILFGVWPHRLDGNRDRSDYQFFVGKNRNREIRANAFECCFDASRQKWLPHAEAMFSTGEVERFTEFDPWSD